MMVGVARMSIVRVALVPVVGTHMSTEILRKQQLHLQILVRDGRYHRIVRINLGSISARA